MNHTQQRNVTLDLRRVLISLIVLALSGCAGQPTTTFQPFKPKDLNSKVQSGYFKQKVDNFMVIMDASSSMNETYLGVGFPETSTATKFSVEKEFLHRMNKTIPRLKMNFGLRSFGFGPCLSWSFTELKAPIAPYTPSAFQSVLDTQECASGGTPLAEALEAADDDLRGARGKIAVIVVSDGKQMSVDPQAAVAKLKHDYGDRLCLYTVAVSNPDDLGAGLMAGLPGHAACGGRFSVGDVVSSDGAADFVTKVFLERGADCSSRDSDEDGVNDCIDRCPDTPRGAKVNNVGCWVLSNVLFDYDKASIKPVSYSELYGVVRVFEENPGLRVEVDGHTDGQGSDAYNLGLSQRRAEAVREFIVRNGVASGRLTARGFGKTQPVATNDTAEGRALNRRVELKVLK